jgi:phosphoesterase RecJ-like protein
MKIDTSLQPILDLLNSGSIQNLLISSGKNVDPDAVGSALGLALALQEKIPSITVAIEEFDATGYSFLPGIDRIANSIGQKSLVVSIDVGNSPIEKINYNTQDTTFNLILTPKTGQVDVDQIQYSYTGVQFDAVITVDTAKKDLLGQWITNFSTELADTPIINIDHHPDNEQFGTLNYIQAQAPSASAIVFEVIKALELPFTADIATNLLAGLLSDTSGFANSNSSADTLRLAADLIDQGANLHQLMISLFRTLSLPAMHLWGSVLNNIHLEQPGVIMTQLSQGEIAATQATDTDVDTLGTLVNNILVADHTAQLAVLLKEKGKGEVSGSMRAIADIDVSAIARQLGGGGHIKAAGFRLTETTLEQARQQVLKAIQQTLPTTKATNQPDEKANNVGQ